jgi:hypothetical protein
MAENDRCPACGGFRGLPRMLHDDDSPKECADAFHSAKDVIEFPSPAEAEAVDTSAPPDPAPAPTQSPETQESLRKRPICPYCGQEGKIIGSLTDLGPMKIMVVRCASDDCRKILSMFQPLGLEMLAPPGLPPGFKH